MAGFLLGMNYGPILMTNFGAAMPTVADLVLDMGSIAKVKIQSTQAELASPLSSQISQLICMWQGYFQQFS